MKFREFLFSFKAGLKLYYKPLLLSLLISCLSFPAYDLFFSSGLDNSLPWVFNYFADGRLSEGRSILFPHGPLAFLLYPLPEHNNLVICTAITFFCSVLVSLNLFRICKALHRENDALVLLASLVMHAFMDIQLLLIALTLSQALLFRISGRRADLALAMLFGVFNLFIKAYGGILCGLILAGLGLCQGLVKKDRATALSIPALFLLFFYLFWLGLYGSFGGSLTFLRGQLELSSDNSEAVALYTNINWLPLSISLISLAAIPLITKDAIIRQASLLMLLPFFAGWKHAMARADELHMSGYLNLLLFFFLFIWILHRGPGIATFFLGGLSLLAFILNMAETGFLQQKNIPLLRPYNLYTLMAGYEKKVELSRKQSAWEIRQKILPDSLLQLIGKSTVDVYPWNYSIIAANGLNWKPRPVIHSYATYTSWLDRQNAAHVRSEQAARFLLWEISKDTYQELHRLEGIDNRYLLNDGPASTLSIFSNYALKFKNKNYLLYERRTVPAQLSYTVTEAAEFAYNQWINVPDQDPGHITRAQLDIHKSPAGLLKSFFYKGEGFYIHYEMEDHRVLKNRIVPKNAKEGLWINPHVVIPENNYLESNVKRIRITCDDTTMVTPTFRLAFETIAFSSSDTAKEHNLQQSLFGKYEKRQVRILDPRPHVIDSITNPRWLESLDMVLTSASGKPGESYYTLKPEGYSGHCTFLANTDSLAAGSQVLEFTISANISGKDPKAVFVISHTHEGKQLSWLPMSLGPMVQNVNGWTPMRFSMQTDLRSLKAGHQLHIYFWNPDLREEFYIDDLLITVEAREH